MDRLLVTVDMGNSRTKACRWSYSSEGLLRLQARLEVKSEPAGLLQLQDWLAAEDRRLAEGAYAAVAAHALEQELLHLLEARCERVLDRRAVGLKLCIRSPETVGDDRLFAARGAVEAAQGSALVVDAGTALTVDAVAWPTTTEPPAFLGGAIAPGPELLARALALGGARLPEIQPRPGVHALGRDTREALEAGIAVGFEGTAQRLLERIASESGIYEPVFITGGAAGFLLDALPRARHLPELVHRGLLASLGHGAP